MGRCRKSLKSLRCFSLYNVDIFPVSMKLLHICPDQFQSFRFPLNGIHTAFITASSDRQTHLHGYRARSRANIITDTVITDIKFLYRQPANGFLGHRNLSPDEIFVFRVLCEINSRLFCVRIFHNNAGKTSKGPLLLFHQQFCRGSFAENTFCFV